MRRLVCVLALTATPLLHGLAFPPADLHLLVWIALVPWFAAIRLTSARTALALSAVVSLTGTYLVAGWLPRAASGYYGQPFVVGALLFVGAWCVTLAPWFLGFAAAYRAMAARRSAWIVPLLVGAAWAGMEICRVRGPSGHPFGPLAYSPPPGGPRGANPVVTGGYRGGFPLAGGERATTRLTASAA